ncbi:thiol:disulfide interchange protein [Escherichia coli]|uniref:Thiol:disulfide interchange protein n=1 Tax=Escherichia coli TaxID=562 RepID=A0A376Y3J2_ECOLX|nr:thiol:disulfide interchange protein [Escherichia coli]
MKKGFMLFTLLAAFSGFAQADDAAIQQTLAKMASKQRYSACTRGWHEDSSD